MNFLSKIDAAKTKGLKVFMIGLLAAIAGFLIALVGAVQVGWAIIWLAWIVCAVGLIWHFWLMFSTRKGKPEAGG